MLPIRTRRRACLAVCAAASLALAWICVALAAGERARHSAVAAGARAPRYRYMYDSGGSQRTVAEHGWNLLDVGSRSAADALPPGTRGLVWVGDYDNSTCAWEVSDRELESSVAGMAQDENVAGFFFSDEPDPAACPTAPAQHAARSRLMHRLAPRKLTVMVADSNSGGASLRQISQWVGAADYVGLDPYPCRRGGRCAFGWIDAIIRAADRAGLRYWGVVQAFDDSSWRWPTAGELRRMLSRWADSRQSGYMTFAWKWAGHTLQSRASLLSVLRRFNRGMRP